MRTPAKIPVHKTLEDCREMVFGRAVEVHEEYAGKGWLPQRLNLNAGIVRGMLEIFAWVLFAFYEVLARALKNAFPLEAEGEWLDMHLGQVLLEKRLATKASGVVEFYRADDTPDGNIRIPPGRIIRTRPDGRGMVYRYTTTAEAVLPSGAASVAIPVEAEEYGQAANATPGQICEISTHIPGIGRVWNGPGWLLSEGADEETPAQIQERYTLAWLEKAGCTAAAYKSWALSVPGVLSVAVLDQHPRGEGTVDVIVRGTAGIPTETLLKKVREAVAAKAPVNDRWEARGPVEVPVIIRLEAEITGGTVPDAELEAENRIRALFAGSGVALEGLVPFGIGEDFTRDRVVAAIVRAGVKRLVWAEPAAVVHVPQDGLASLAAITVTATVVGA